METTDRWEWRFDEAFLSFEQFPVRLFPSDYVISVHLPTIATPSSMPPVRRMSIERKLDDIKIVVNEPSLTPGLSTPSHPSTSASAKTPSDAAAVPPSFSSIASDITITPSSPVPVDAPVVPPATPLTPATPDTTAASSSTNPTTTGSATSSLLLSPPKRGRNLSVTFHPDKRSLIDSPAASPANGTSIPSSASGVWSPEAPPLSPNDHSRSRSNSSNIGGSGVGNGSMTDVPSSHPPMLASSSGSNHNLADAPEASAATIQAVVTAESHRISRPPSRRQSGIGIQPLTYSIDRMDRVAPRGWILPYVMSWAEAARYNEDDRLARCGDGVAPRLLIPDDNDPLQIRIWGDEPSTNGVAYGMGTPSSRTGGHHHHGGSIIQTPGDGRPRAQSSPRATGRHHRAWSSTLPPAVLRISASPSQNNLSPVAQSP
jgi:hypothetical protein